MSVNDLHPKNTSKQWLDYIPEMNAILNTLHQRILNLEIVLQANNQMSNRAQSMIEQNFSNVKSKTMIGFSQELVPNLIDTSSERSIRNSLTLEKQLDKLNLSSQMSFEQTKESISLPPHQMKTRAYEFTAIFEDTFDQLNVLHTSLSTTNHQDINSNCSPYALNLTGIFTMNESDKFRYEIEYFSRLLLLFFRALLLDSSASINNIHNHHELIHLQNRLKTSQEQISKLSFIKKHFHTDTFEQLNILRSTNAQLKDHFMEEKSRSKVALHYCHDWKKNHLFQWIEMLLQIEQDYLKTIQQYEINLKQNEITHEETIRVLIEQRDEMKSNSNRWYEYYQNETSRFERELTDFRFEFNQMKRQRQEMSQEYQRMNVIVDEYNQIKIKKRLFLEKQKQEEEAMKRIQAWWKGTMTRHLKQKKRTKKKKKKKN